MILGIDQSLQSTGVCMFVDSTCAETRALAFPSVTGLDRLAFILQGVRDVIDAGGGAGSFELAVLEGYAYGGTGMTFHLAELGGLLRWHLAREWGIPYIVVPPSTLKKFVTGNGRADKVQMCEVARLVYDRDFLKTSWSRRKGTPKPDDWGQKDEHWRDDEADAFFLANVGAFYNGTWDRVATLDQRAILEELKLDPQGVLTRSAKDRALGKPVKKKKVIA